MSIPLIGIPANVRNVGTFDYHGVAKQFVAPLIDYLGFQPVIIPDLPTSHDNAPLLDILDGVLLTGSVSNIHPSIYDAEVEGDQSFDEKRDALSLPLIRACVARGIPLFGICRGMQEINVAFGGSLIQALHMHPKYIEHRGWVKYQTPADMRAHHAHSVTVTPGGLLHKITKAEGFMVNSLHAQGIDKLGDGITIEAVAEDNSVEAISVASAATFTLGTLWHPEWLYDTTPASVAIFDAFGAAVWQRHKARPRVA